MLPYADRIIVLNKGVIINDGPYQKILAENPEIAVKSLISSNKQSISSEDKHSEIETDIIEKQAAKTNINSPEEALVIKKQDLLRRDGTWDVYKYYIKSAGYKTTALFVFCVLVTGFFSNFASKFGLILYSCGFVFWKLLLIVNCSSLASMVVRCK
jgi:ABC-type sulfate/molybdate transport systems ATPase subunit